MIWNIIVTHDCNKNCRYCLNQEADVPFPRRIAYDIKDLKSFLEKDRHPVIAFYGGEPLLGLDMIQRIMDEIEIEKYVIQTNGYFLDRIPDAYLGRFDCMLVSIDGRRETTDYYRGDGTHDRVFENVTLLREKSFKGEITARMCISEHSDVYNDVTYLLGLKDGHGKYLFNGIHWQNDFMFGDMDNWKDLDGWLERSYYPGIERLAGEWVTSIEKSGTVRLVYPFVGIVRTLLSGEPARLHCGCGHANNNICTDGRITACPVSSDFYQIFELGNIFEYQPHDFKDAMLVGEPCPSCDIFNVCGGRCLYANKLKPWGEEGYRKVCETIHHLVRTLESRLPDIKRMIDSQHVKLSQFDYFQYNGCEIIP